MYGLKLYVNNHFFKVFYLVIDPTPYMAINMQVRCKFLRKLLYGEFGRYPLKIYRQLILIKILDKGSKLTRAIASEAMLDIFIINYGFDLDNQGHIKVKSILGEIKMSVLP